MVEINELVLPVIEKVLSTLALGDAVE